MLFDFIIVNEADCHDDEHNTTNTEILCSYEQRNIGGHGGVTTIIDTNRTLKADQSAPQQAVSPSKGSKSGGMKGS